MGKPLTLIAVGLLALPSAHLGDALVAALSLAVLILWPRWVPKVPGHLAALAVGTLAGLALEALGIPLATLGERFSYTLDGSQHPGIPPFLPSLSLPWLLPGADGQPLPVGVEQGGLLLHLGIGVEPGVEVTQLLARQFAVERQMDDGTLFVTPCEMNADVAELLGARYGLPMWRFTNSGTEADSAIRWSIFIR